MRLIEKKLTLNEETFEHEMHLTVALTMRPIQAARAMDDNELVQVLAHQFVQLLMLEAENS